MKCRPLYKAGSLGSEAGTALASVLVGDANPSGKLPFTFPAKLEDVGAHKLGEYPGNKEELAQSKHRGDTINEIYGKIFL